MNSEAQKSGPNGEQGSEEFGQGEKSLSRDPQCVGAWAWQPSTQVSGVASCMNIVGGPRALVVRLVWYCQ